MRIALTCGVCVPMMLAAAAAQDDGGNVDPAPSGHEETVIVVDTETGASVAVPGADAGVVVTQDGDTTNIDFDTEWEGGSSHPDDTTIIYDSGPDDSGDGGFDSGSGGEE